MFSSKAVIGESFEELFRIEDEYVMKGWKLANKTIPDDKAPTTLVFISTVNLED